MESIGRDLNEMQRVPLAEAHVAALRAAGTIGYYAAGAFVVKPGGPVDRFVYILDGEVEVVNSFTGERNVAATRGPTQFMGEISLLNGSVWSMPLRAARDTQVIEVPRLVGCSAENPEGFHNKACGVRPVGLSTGFAGFSLGGLRLALATCASALRAARAVHSGRFQRKT